MIKDSGNPTRRDILKGIAAAAFLPLLANRAVADKNQDPADASIHRIMTCNILLDLPEQEKDGHDWTTRRRPLCEKIIKTNNPDIICLQEVGRKQHEHFMDSFPDFHNVGYPDPYVDKNPPRFQAIKNVVLFKKDRYDLVSSATYWLSDTPHIAGSRLEGTGLPRHVTWVRVRDKQSGRHFRVLNTHWALEAPIRMKEAQIIAPEAAQYLDDFPQILCGDFNSDYRSPEQKVLFESGWTDTYETVHGNEVPVKTGHGYRTPEEQAKRPNLRIDCIFAGGNVDAVASKIIKDSENGLYPSDHYFVSADVRI